MENFQNRGQGTLNSIMGMVIAFLVLDIIVAALMYFNIKFPDNNPVTDNVPVATPIITVKATDNSPGTDNVTNK